MGVWWSPLKSLPLHRTFFSVDGGTEVPYREQDINVGRRETERYFDLSRTTPTHPIIPLAFIMSVCYFGHGPGCAAILGHCCATAPPLSMQSALRSPE